MARSNRVVLLVGLALALVVPCLGLGHAADHIQGLPPHLGSETFWWGLTILILLYVRAVERRPFASIGFKRPTWQTFAFGAAAMALVYLTIGSIQLFVFPLWHIHQDQQALRTITGFPLWYRVAIVVRASIAEEVMFRGYGIERLQELTGSRFVAGAITLAAFTIGHLAVFGWTHIIIAGGTGLILTLLYIWRRDLGANMVAHFLIDGVSVILAP
jgi:membrane protease YdiL (CAAX protease family)